MTVTTLSPTRVRFLCDRCSATAARNATLSTSYELPPPGWRRLIYQTDAGALVRHACPKCARTALESGE